MRVNDSHLSSTYVAVIDADVDAARKALQAINPMPLLTTQLSALGLNDQAVWVGSSEKTGGTGADGAPELDFSLLWRFGPPGQTARIVWQIRLSEDAVGRAVLSIAIRAPASDNEAGKRITAGWPIVETITLEHAKSVRRAVEDYAADPYEAERPRTSTVLNAAA